MHNGKKQTKQGMKRKVMGEKERNRNVIKTTSGQCQIAHRNCLPTEPTDMLHGTRSHIATPAEVEL